MIMKGMKAFDVMPNFFRRVRIAIIACGCEKSTPKQQARLYIGIRKWIEKIKQFSSVDGK